MHSQDLDADFKDSCRAHQEKLEKEEQQEEEVVTPPEEPGDEPPAEEEPWV